MPGKTFILKVVKGEIGENDDSIVLQQGDEVLLIADFHGEKVEIERVKRVAVPSTIRVDELAQPQSGQVALITFA